MRKYSALLLITVTIFLFNSRCTTSGNGNEALSADGVPIAYEVHGKGEPALVFIHGWCCDRSYWKFQVSHFSRRHRVVTIDLAGHGESGIERAAWTVQAFGEDVAAVVKKLGLDRVVLVGHSMGGSVILEAARLMPGRVIGLVGVDTYQNFEADFSVEQQERFLSAFKADFAGMTGNFVRSMFTPEADSALIEQVAADMSSAPPEVGIGAMKNLLGYKPSEALDEVEVPIRSINSDKFPTNVEGNKRVAPSFEMRLMPGLGHFVMMEDPEGFNRLLAETVEELLKE